MVIVIPTCEPVGPFHIQTMNLYLQVASTVSWSPHTVKCNLILKILPQSYNFNTAQVQNLFRVSRTHLTQSFCEINGHIVHSSPQWHTVRNGRTVRQECVEERPKPRKTSLNPCSFSVHHPASLAVSFIFQQAQLHYLRSIRPLSWTSLM